MSQPVKQAPDLKGSGLISLDELIRAQLQSKSIALARYDEILWKVRGGYIAVMYGMLAFLIGSDSRVIEFVDPEGILQSLFPLSLSMSLCALLLDSTFVLSKLRVITARNELSDVAASRAWGIEFSEIEYNRLTRLLHLSGEEFNLPPLRLILGKLWSVLGIYLITPAAIYFLFA